jgi:hypothetical protein
VQLLKRVLDFAIEICSACGRAVWIIACIEDSDVIEKILTSLDVKGGEPEATRQPPCRAPPKRAEINPISLEDREASATDTVNFPIRTLVVKARAKNELSLNRSSPR